MKKEVPMPTRRLGGDGSGVQHKSTGNQAMLKENENPN